MKDLAGGKHTTAAIGSSSDNGLPDKALVKNWDQVPGHMQHRDRVLEREGMGQKRTPTGRTVLRRSR